MLPLTERAPAFLRRMGAALGLLATATQSGTFALVGGLGVIPEAPLCAARPVAASTPRKPVSEVTSVGITYFAGRSRDGDDAHLAAALTSELAHQLLSARV